MPKSNLLTRARTYLQSKGFAFIDLGIYCPDSDDYEYGGIALRSNLNTDADGLTIYVVDPECALTSNQIVLSTKEENLLEPILDALMFAVKHGKSVSNS